MKKVKVEFTAAERIAVDGIHITKFNVGDVVELPEAIAEIACADKAHGGLGCARVIGYVNDTTVKDAGAAPENKMMTSEVIEVEKKTEPKKMTKTAPAAARGRGRSKGK